MLAYKHGTPTLSIAGTDCTEAEGRALLSNVFTYAQSISPYPPGQSLSQPMGPIAVLGSDDQISLSSLLTRDSSPVELSARVSA
jgi:hypothetical protein